MSSTKGPQAIHERRNGLIIRGDLHRSQIALEFENLRPRVDYVTNLLRLVNSLRSNIGVIGGIVAVLAVRRPGAMRSWVRRGWIVWQLVRHYKRG
jgi:YqjK-like protein